MPEFEFNILIWQLGDVDTDLNRWGGFQPKPSPGPFPRRMSLLSGFQLKYGRKKKTPPGPHSFAQKYTWGNSGGQQEEAEAQEKWWGKRVGVREIERENLSVHACICDFTEYLMQNGTQTLSCYVDLYIFMFHCQEIFMNLLLIRLLLLLMLNIDFFFACCGSVCWSPTWKRHALN